MGVAGSVGGDQIKRRLAELKEAMKGYYAITKQSAQFAAQFRLYENQYGPAVVPPRPPQGEQASWTFNGVDPAAWHSQAQRSRNGLLDSREAPQAPQAPQPPQINATVSFNGIDMKGDQVAQMVALQVQAGLQELINGWIDTGNRPIKKVAKMKAPVRTVAIA